MLFTLTASAQNVNASNRMQSDMFKAMQNGDMDTATEIGERWIEMLERVNAPDRVVAQAAYLLGIAYQGLNDFDSADDNLTRALDLMDGLDQPTDNEKRSTFSIRIKLAELNMERSPAKARKYLEDNDDLLRELDSIPLSFMNDYHWARYWWNASDVRKADDHLKKVRSHFSELRGMGFGLYLLARTMDANVQMALRNDAKSLAIAEDLAAEIKAASKQQIAQGVGLFIEVIRLLQMHGKDSEAEDLTRWSIDLAEREQSVPKWTVATLKETLAVSLVKGGQLGEAIRLLKEAVDLSSAKDSPPGYANLLVNLGTALSKNGTAADALPYYERARKTLRNMSSPEKNTLFRVDEALAQAWYFKGDREKAVRYGLESIEIYDDLLGKMLGRSPLSDAAANFAFLKSFSAADVIIDSGDAGAIATVLLKRKGRMFSQVWPRVQASNRRRQDDLWRTREDFFFAVESAGSDKDPASQEQKLKKARGLAESIVNLEAQEPGRSRVTKLTPSTLRKNVDPGTVVIDFISYPKLTVADPTKPPPNTRGPEQLGAILYTAQNEPVWVKLGGADEIKQRMEAWDQVIVKSYLRENDLINALQGLYGAVWKPIEAALPSGIDKVIVCTDAPIHFLPFGALRDDDGKFLMERYAFSSVQNLADAAEMKTPKLKNSDRVFVASQEKFASSPDPATQSLNLRDLEGGKLEVAAINEIMPASRVSAVRNEEATEAEIRRRMTGYDIVHLVTHSLYYPQVQKTATWDQFKDNLSALLVRDLMGSTLVVEGCGTAIEKWKRGAATNTENDGLLTLADVGRLDLSRVKIAVLSACETQLAPAYAGEGLLGFERALHAAGVGNVVLSLWRVPDADSAQFFERFYRKLETSHNMQSAFVQTQREVFAEMREKSLKDAIRAVGCFIYSRDYIHE